MRPVQRRKTDREVVGLRLNDILNPDHSLVKLAKAIDWRLLEGHFGSPQGALSEGRPSQVRLIVGLSVLKQLHDLTDEALCESWLENPYFQFLCGEEYFQHSFAYNRAAVIRGLRRLSPEKLRTLMHAGLSYRAGINLDDMPELSRLGIEAKHKQAVSRPFRKDQNGEKAVSISIKTVSLVLNRQPNVSLPTRTAVLAAIEALKFHPNVFARGLASERSYLIGLLYDVPPGSYVADLQFGALARCREEGYHLIVEMLNPQHDLDLSQRVRVLVSESVLHGVILTQPLCDERSVIEELTHTQTPFVRIAPGTKMTGSFTVSIDEFKAAYEMTAYLVGLGHRSIGFVKGKPDHGASRVRFDGYRAALADAGMPFLEEYCAQGFFTYQSGLEAGERLLSLKKRPTAIFAGNDDMAAGVLAVCQRFNLKIPEDLSLAGFDDSMVAQVVWPRLTTCRQPIKEMAAAAVSILTQKRELDRPLEWKLDHQLVVRESTASPSK